MTPSNRSHAAAATITATPTPALNGDGPATAIRHAYPRRIDELRGYGAE